MLVLLKIEISKLRSVKIDAMNSKQDATMGGTADNALFMHRLRAILRAVMLQAPNSVMALRFNQSQVSPVTARIRVRGGTERG